MVVEMIHNLNHPILPHGTKVPVTRIKGGPVRELDSWHQWWSWIEPATFRLVAQCLNQLVVSRAKSKPE